VTVKPSIRDTRPGPPRAGAEPALGLMADAAVFLSTLLLAALTVVAIAVAAPVALIVSALAGVFLKGRERGRWRAAGAA
jgi:hypothetical protein